MEHRVIRYLSLIGLLFWAGCARMVTPVGGPKDVTPPTIVKEIPANRSTNFTGNSFKITFNEYVVLNSTTDNVLISPPPRTAPTYTLTGKSLVVKLADTLQPNQTYNFAFTNCIKDFTEGNPIPIYNYAFSTGNYIDSFMLKGRVVDALTTKPVSEVMVMAYRAHDDSLPLTTRPDFVTKSSSDGQFEIPNVPAGCYKLFALKDGNKNFLFDRSNEPIAFLHTCVDAIPITDTTRNDSLTKPRTSNPQSDCILRLFEEADTLQAFSKIQNKEMGKYELIYRNKVNNVQARFLSHNAVDYFQIVEDKTITWFCKDSVKDTLYVEVIVNENCCDTLKLLPFKKKEQRGRRTDKGEFLKVTAQQAGELYKPLVLHFSYPVRPADSIPALFITKNKRAENDTTYITLTVADSFVHEITLPLRLEEKVSYQLILADSLLWGYNNLPNDSVKIDFVAKTTKDYGALRMSYLIPDTTNYVVQLLDSKDAVIDERHLRESQEVFYNHLAVGEYKIKVIADSNGDGKWTTGNYKQQMLPEQIIYFPKSIYIRGNWELEEQFEIPLQ